MLKLILTVLTGIVGAGLLHLVIILSLPSFSERDTYSRVEREGAAFQFHPVSDKPDAAGLVKDDPFLEVAVCAFDISDEPVRMTATNTVPFWSFATFDSAANETFSINDRTAADRKLDLIVATPVQATALRKALPSSALQPIIVETTREQGYAVLRALSPQASFREATSAFLTSATCSPMEWE